MICPNCGCNCETGEVPVSPAWEDRPESARYDAALARIARGEVSPEVREIEELRRMLAIGGDHGNGNGAVDRLPGDPVRGGPADSGTA